MKPCCCIFGSGTDIVLDGAMLFNIAQGCVIANHIWQDWLQVYMRRLMESDFVLSHLQNGSHNIAIACYMQQHSPTVCCPLPIERVRPPPVGCPLAH